MDKIKLLTRKFRNGQLHWSRLIEWKLLQNAFVDLNTCDNNWNNQSDPKENYLLFFILFVTEIIIK